MGFDGFTYLPRPGRPRIHPPESIRGEILALVNDPSSARERHWTAVKLCGCLRENRDLEHSYPTLVPY